MSPAWKERVSALESNLKLADAAGAAMLETLIYALCCKPEDFEDHQRRVVSTAKVAASFALDALGREAWPETGDLT